ncbi:hypothetical protein BKA69DRAFT_1128445 [Paraphysoderma sedebokerense]|nr:hypothetical protein BKA69DRAFT_1128445 [Paraphysoderma sedebokerense]
MEFVRFWLLPAVYCVLSAVTLSWLALELFVTWKKQNISQQGYRFLLMSTSVTVLLFFAGTPFRLLQSYFHSEYTVTHSASAIALALVFQTLKMALLIGAGGLNLSMGLGRLLLFESLLSTRIRSVCRFISKITPYYTVVFMVTTSTKVIERMPTSDPRITAAAISVIKPVYLILFGIYLISILFTDVTMVSVVFQKSYEFQKEDEAMIPVVKRVLAVMCFAILVLLSAVAVEALNVDATINGTTELMLQIYFTLHLYVLRGVKQFVKENSRVATESRRPQSSVANSRSQMKSVAVITTVPIANSKNDPSNSVCSI